MAGNSDDEGRKPVDKGKGKRVGPESDDEEDGPYEAAPHRDSVSGWYARQTLEDTNDDWDPLDGVGVRPNSAVQTLLDEKWASQSANQPVTSSDVQQGGLFPSDLSEYGQLQLALQKSLDDLAPGAAQDIHSQVEVSEHGSIIDPRLVWETLPRESRAIQFPTLARVYDDGVPEEAVDQTQFFNDLKSVECIEILRRKEASLA